MATIRLQKNMTQKELSERSGVSIQSVKRLESGEVATRLTIFIAICRTLEILDRFEVLLPTPTPRPIDLFKLQGKVRQRARKSKSEKSAPWEWSEGQ